VGSEVSLPPPAPVLSQMNPVHTLPPDVDLMVDYPPNYAWVFRAVTSLQTYHQKFVCISHLPNECYMPRPSHPPWFDHPNNVKGGATDCNFLQSPLTSSLLGQIFSSAPCSQTPSKFVLPLMWYPVISRCQKPLFVCLLYAFIFPRIYPCLSSIQTGWLSQNRTSRPKG
jgi:hypothetical protein